MVRPRGRPTPSEWEAIKPELEHLYLRQNWTLKAVSDYFAARGFVATVRQYKTKVNAWGFDVKKIKRPIWHSMYVVMRARQESGLSSAFIVPVRGHVRTVVRSDKILKETNRNKSVLDSSNQRRAHLILERAEVIVCRDEDGEIREKLRSGPFNATSSSLHSDSNQMSPELLFSDDQAGNASSSPSESADLSPTMTDEDSSGLAPIAATSSGMDRRSFSFSTAGSTVQPHAPVKSDMSGPTGTFDVGTILNSLFSDPSCNDQMNDNLQRSTQQIIEDKQLAVRLASPYLQSFYERRSHEPKIDEFGRQDAKIALRCMLKSSNKYIFPYCHWMTTVLASSGMTALLTEFLTDCCEVIDQDKMGYELTYGSPLHLALALYTANPEDIKMHQHRFMRSTTAIQIIWGKDSPNWLVNQHYYAWLLLEQQQHQEAVKILENCLPISERIMGTQHLITMNCLAIMSRALAELGREAKAIAVLQDVLGRLANCAEILHAFRDRQVMRLAELQEKTGHSSDAEAHYRATLAFRLQHFGMLSDFTWYSIGRFRSFLAAQGRQQESDHIWQYYSDFYNQEKEEENEEEKRHLQP